MGDKRDSKFSAGLVVGAIIGGVSAFLLTPKTGKENRKLLAKKYRELQDSLDIDIKEKVEEIFGEVTEEGTKLYKSAKKDLKKRLDEVKGKIEDFDQEKYATMVGEVIDDVKDQVQGSSKHVEKLKTYLLENWDKLAEKQEETGSKKKTAKKKS